MGHTTANDLLQHFTNITEPMNHSSIIHLSMEGPSVNHKFYRDLKEYRERVKLPEMINFGSCNLHTLHAAFKSGFESTDCKMIVLHAEMITSLLQNQLNFLLHSTTHDG